jgi:hypothetical protein
MWWRGGKHVGIYFEARGNLATERKAGANRFGRSAVTKKIGAANYSARNRTRTRGLKIFRASA